MSSRDTIRKTLLAKRASLSGGDIQSASLAAASKLMNSDTYKNAQHIACYMAQNGEMDPAAILTQALSEGKQCYLPTLDPITENTLIFVSYTTGESLVRNRYQILEPIIKPSNVVGAKMLDLVLVPLVGFDNLGNRLGMGKGYYDRTFAFKKHGSDEQRHPLLMGLGYEFQRQPAIENQAWDVPLDGIITERTLEIF